VIRLLADVSKHVTCGINASRRIDVTFANPNPTSPALQPDTHKKYHAVPPVQLREQ
jgi:hypothetical protein